MNQKYIPNTIQYKRIGCELSTLSEQSNKPRGSEIMSVNLQLPKVLTQSRQEYLHKFIKGVK